MTLIITRMVIMVPTMVVVMVVMLTLQTAEVIDTPSDGDVSGCDGAVGLTALVMMMMKMPGVIVKMGTVTVARTGRKRQCEEERVFWLHCTCGQDVMVGRDYLNLSVKSANPTWRGDTVKETDRCGADSHCVLHFVTRSYCDSES